MWITIDNGDPVFSETKVDDLTKPLDSGWYLGTIGSTSKTLKISGKVTDANGLKETDGFTVKHYKMNSNNTWPADEDTSGTKPDSSCTGPGSDGKFTDTLTRPKESGTYKVVYSATDKYGQESSVEFEYQVDVDAPVIKNDDIKIDNKTVSSNTITGYVKDNNVEVSVNVKDADSGVTKVEYFLDQGTSWKSMVISGTTAPEGYENWSSSVAFDDGNAEKIRLRVTDGVGLTKLYPESGGITVTVDKTAPTMGLKYYQIEGNTSYESVSGKAYVNGKNLIIYANYNDVDQTKCSGVAAPEFKIVKADETEVPLTPTITYYTKEHADDAPATTTVTTDGKATQSFKAVISHDDFVDGDLYIKGSDAAGNTIRGEWVKALSLEKDNNGPEIGAITLTKAYKKGNSYYVRNTKDGNLIIKGTTTDDHKVDKTVLEVSGFTTQPASDPRMNWEYSLDLSTLTADQTITIRAYDKAGNPSTTETINVVFDEYAPMLLIGQNGPAALRSDSGDTSNPYVASYTSVEQQFINMAT